MENEEYMRCDNCDKRSEECDEKTVSECLKKSSCTYCDGTVWGYPYGRDESRHCLNCGAEWSIWH